MQTKTKAYIAFAATGILWGSTWEASKIGVGTLPGLQFSAIRQCIAGLLIIGYFMAKGQPLPTRRQFVFLAGMGFFTFFLSNGVSTWGLNYISGGMAALIAAMYPLFVVLIEIIFFKKNIARPATFLGLAMGIGGIVLVFYENAIHQNTPHYWKGILLCLIATLGWSVGTILLAGNTLQMHRQYALGWQMLSASFFIGLLAFVTGNHIPFHQITLTSWFAMAYLVVAGSILAFKAFLYTMEHLTPSVAALYAYINPIVALLIGAALLNDALTFTNIVGSLITLAGVYIVNRSVQVHTMTIADAEGM